ncbi:MAG: LacI family DNA-binding transcriptional regulator [Rhodobacteraceae bacterium]|nr:LacI family DNA-binding transcriptional regulator [Paracoccaceae bacterium]
MKEKSLQRKAMKLSDVAQHANVSVVTVSRALRQPELVSQDTLDKVSEAVKALGYVPNPAAQALASARSRLIGVVIPSLTNQIFAELLRGVMDGVEGTTYTPQFVNTRYKLSREEDLLRVFATQRPAGMIVAGIDQSAAARRLLEQMGCPVVQVMETDSDPVDMAIGCDQRDAGRAAVRHLIEQGYRRIGFLGARMDPRAQRRLAGYNDVMSAHGLSDDALVVTTSHPSAYSVGGQLMADLLASAPDADAVFCNNDDVALGALFECQRRGLRVPEQMGIVGFNDLDVVSCSVPTITSVRTHRYETGLKAVNMIIDQINGSPPEHRIIDAGYDLRIRSSTSRQQKGG